MEYRLERLDAEMPVSEYVAHFVDVEHFLNCCKECPNYGKVWSCPEYDFNPIDFWNNYTSVQFSGYQLNYEGERTLEEMTDVLFQVKQSLLEELLATEKQFPNSYALSAGSCQQCEKCAREAGEPCKKPHLMRYSVESLGGNVGLTIKELFHRDIQFATKDSLPDHFFLIGGLLKA